MTIPEMRLYLASRYEEQALRFPLLRRIPKARYIRVNLSYMRTSHYWGRREYRIHEGGQGE